MWWAFFAIVAKDFLQLRRNVAVVRRVLLFQALNFLMLAWLDLVVHDMPAVIVDQDHTAESRELVERVAAAKTLDFKFSTSSIDQARAHIRAGRANAALIIPPGFARARAARESGHVLVLVDGSDPVASTQATGAVTGVATTINVEAEEERVELAPTVTSHDVLLFNPEGRTPNFLLPALLAILLGTTFSINPMRSLITERTGGYLERILMTPVRYWTLLVGKLVPWFVLGIVDAALFLLVARWGFGVPIRGSLLLLLGSTALYVATILAASAWIAAGSRSMAEAMAAWALWNLPAVFLTGYVFPLSAIPKWLLPVSYALPQTHFIEIMRGICLRGANARELTGEILYLAVAPVIFTLFAAIRFSRSVEAG